MGGLAYILVAVLAFVSVAGVGWVVAGDPGGAVKKKRLKAVSVGSTSAVKPRRRKAASAAEVAQARRRQVQETLKQLEDRQRRQRRKSLTLRAQLRQAGLGVTPAMFWLISGVIAAAVFLPLVLREQGLLLSGGLAFVAGFGLPRWFLGMRRTQRMKKFTEEFVNAIDIIVRGVKAGLPLNECLKMIVREIQEPVAGEFRKLAEEQAMGVTTDESLGRMYQRMPLPELNFFSTVLIIQQKTGGNLAEALANLSAVLRSRKMIREKIAALSSEAKASAFIIGSLPPTVMALVYFTTPSYMSTMFTEPLGRLMLGGGLLWMLAGILVMRRMINFKF